MDERALKKVVLDSGHGGTDSKNVGKVSSVLFS